MEPKFQTSFIPKKQITSVGGLTGNSMGSGPVQQKAKANLASAYMAIAVIVFIISVGAVGGAYFWKSYLKSANEQYKIDLAKMEEKFDINLIKKLKAKNIQIDSAKRLISNHVALSQAFDIVQRMTVADVRFSTMDFKGDSESGGKYVLNIKGQGKNLATVAFQSDVLADLAKYGLDGVIKNPIISSPTLELSGAVSFGLTADLDKGSVSYTKSVTGESK
jgi:hypothetical protein